MSFLLKGDFGSIPLHDVVALKIKYNPANTRYAWEVVAVSKEAKCDITLGFAQYEETAKEALTKHSKVFEKYLESCTATKTNQ